METRFIERIRLVLTEDPRIKSALVLAIGIRLLLLPWFSDSLNFYGFQLTTSFLRQGQDPWIAITSDPAVARFDPWGYPPLFLLVTYISSVLSFGNGYLFGVLVRMPNVLADLLTGFFLFRIGVASNLTRRNSIGLAFAYLFNPFVIIVSSIWGTLDPLPVMFTAGAFYFMIRKPRNTDLAALLLGIGIAFKLYPLIFIPLALAKIHQSIPKIRFLLLSAAPLSITSIPAFLYSPHQFLAVMAGFTIGVSSVSTGGFYLSPWWILSIARVRGSSLALITAESLYVTFLLWLSWACLKNKMSLTRASTIAILALFAVFPRINENYFLWTIPFLVVSSRTEAWTPRSRTFAELLWIPFAVSALLYNGVSVATGLFYWSLISLGLKVDPPSILPNWTQPILYIAFLPFLFTAIVTLIQSRRSKSQMKRTISTKLPFSPTLQMGKRRTYLLILVFFLIFTVSTATLNSYHYPVLPEDYGSYVFHPSSVVVTDDFHAILLGFTYHHGGTGTITPRDANLGGIVLDTKKANGTVWIERAVPNEPLQVSFTVSVIKMYSQVGPIILLRVPGGWLDVRQAATNSTNPLHIEYYDEVKSQQYVVGQAVLGVPFNATVYVASTSTIVAYNKTSFSASGQIPIQNVTFGQTDPGLNGGGIILLTHVEFSWAIIANPSVPAFAPATLSLSAIVLVTPLLWEGLKSQTRGSTSPYQENLRKNRLKPESSK